MEINEKTTKKFRKDFAKAVEQLSKKYDVKITLGNITFSALNFTSKMEVKNKTIDGLPAEEFEFRLHAAAFGFEDIHYKEKIKVNRQDFEFCGFNIKAPKRPCLIRDVKTSEVYVTTLETIQKALAFNRKVAHGNSKMAKS